MERGGTVSVAASSASTEQRPSRGTTSGSHGKSADAKWTAREQCGNCRRAKQRLRPRPEPFAQQIERGRELSPVGARLTRGGDEREPDETPKLERSQHPGAAPKMRARDTSGKPIMTVMGVPTAF
jgi:hypothetical protein